MEQHSEMNSERKLWGKYDKRHSETQSWDVMDKRRHSKVAREKRRQEKQKDRNEFQSMWAESEATLRQAFDEASPTPCKVMVTEGRISVSHHVSPNHHFAVTMQKLVSVEVVLHFEGTLVLEFASWGNPRHTQDTLVIQAVRYWKVNWTADGVTTEAIEESEIEQLELEEEKALRKQERKRNN